MSQNFYWHFKCAVCQLRSWQSS